MLNLLRKFVVHPLKARLRQKAIVSETLQAFRMNASAFSGTLTLPKPFARELNERPVELLMARLLYQPGLEVLDIGHANAMLSHRKFLSLLPEPRQLTGIDIAEPVYDTRPYYKKSIRADITAHPFSDNTFDVIWCISTLEHFGMDISSYTDGFIRDAGLGGKALIEIIRMLKPGGKLLLTVPYGRYEDLGWLINFDAEHWNRLIDVVRDQVKISELYFRHTHHSGWHQVPPVELAYTGYHDQRNFGAAGLAVGILEKK